MLSGGSGTAGSRSEPSQSSCCRRRRPSCRARLATLDELMRDAGRGLLSVCPGAAPRSCALPVAFIAASMANPTRRSLGVRGTPWSMHGGLEGVSSSAGGGLTPSSRLAKAGLRQVPEGPLAGLWLGELSVALPAPVALSTCILGGALRLSSWCVSGILVSGARWLPSVLLRGCQPSCATLASLPMGGGTSSGQGGGLGGRANPARRGLRQSEHSRSKHRTRVELAAGYMVSSTAEAKRQVFSQAGGRTQRPRHRCRREP